jgi:hypothetical protein
MREAPGLSLCVQRVLDETTGEVRLYVHSSIRAGMERGIAERFCTRLEAALQALADGLHQPRRVKDYAKVLVRIGRGSASASPVSPTTIRPAGER